MHKKEIPTQILMWVFSLLLHKPWDRITSNTISTRQAIPLRTLKCLTVKNVHWKHFLVGRVENGDACGEVAQLLIRVFSVGEEGVPFIAGPAVFEIEFLVDTEELVSGEAFHVFGACPHPWDIRV